MSIYALVYDVRSILPSTVEKKTRIDSTSKKRKKETHYKENFLSR